MILLVNGFLFLFMAASAWGTAQVMSDCTGDCTSAQTIVRGMERVTLALILIGLVLLGLGTFLKRNRSPQA